MADLTRKEEKKELKRKLAEKNKALGSTSKVPPLVAPLAAGGAVAGSAYLDGRMGTADNKHPASIAATAVGAVGAVAATVMGHPTLGATMAYAATGPFAFLVGSKTYEAGQNARAKAGSGAAG